MKMRSDRVGILESQFHMLFLRTCLKRSIIGVLGFAQQLFEVSYFIYNFKETFLIRT